MITLKEVNNFNNFTMARKIGQVQRITLSPLGSYLLVYKRDQPINSFKLFNLSDYSQIPIIVNLTNPKVLLATFSQDQKQIYFTNTKGIFTYSLHNKTIQAVIQFDMNNKITDFHFTPNFSVLYYINHSQLFSFDLRTRAPLINTTNSNLKKHNSTKLKYDSKTNTVVTSQDGKTNCTIYKWDIRNNSFNYNISVGFNGCSVNQLYIFGSQLVITKRNYNSANFNNTIVVNYTTFGIITLTSQKMNSVSWPGFIVPCHNYYIQYFAGSNNIFFYKDNFTSKPSNISYRFVFSIAYNSHKDQLYIVSKNQTENLIFKAFTPLFPEYNNPTTDIKTGTPVAVIVVIIITILLLIAAALLYYYKKCKKQSEEQKQEKHNQDVEGCTDTDRQMTEGQKPRSTPTIESNQQLKSRMQEIDQPYQGSNEPKVQTHNLDPEDLEHFSIDEEEPQKENYFSQIESNIQNHLT